MQHANLRSTAAVSALFATTWSFVAGAQQQPGSNVPTPSPSLESTSSPITPALEEPVIDAKTNKSTLPNTPLLVTGVLVLGTSYGASAIAAGLSDRESEDKLYYPVVGPWMAWNDRDCTANPCGNKTLNTTLLIGSGVVQGIGALSMLMSLFIPETTTHEWYLIGNSDVVVTPLIGAGDFGAAAVGRF